MFDLTDTEKLQLALIIGPFLLLLGHWMVLRRLGRGEREMWKRLGEEKAAKQQNEEAEEVRHS